MIQSNSVILIDSTEGINNERPINANSKLSGYVLLAVMKLDKTLNRRGFKWGREHYDIVNGCKSNVTIFAKKYYESTGQYLS